MRKTLGDNMEKRTYIQSVAIIYSLRSKLDGILTLHNI
jgi:hypothetical protein